MKSFIVIVLAALLLVGFCSADSSSMACSMVDGKWECVQNRSPNGNSAAASSFSDGRQGKMAAGAGRPENFDVNYGYNHGKYLLRYILENIIVLNTNKKF